MSRIGKKSIVIPDGVSLNLVGDMVTVRGPRGELKLKMHPDTTLETKDQEALIKPLREHKKIPALWGLMRALVANMIEGVTKGFEKKLEIKGIGYKAMLEGNELVLSLGFSHPVRVPVPPGIFFKVEKNFITVSGNDKSAVGETAAAIRSLKKPEPYKGKGIRYLDEVVKIKAGKKATGTTSGA